MVSIIDYMGFGLCKFTVTLNFYPHHKELVVVGHNQGVIRELLVV